jgi:hypothetical protein
VDPVNRSIDRYELTDDGYALVQSASAADALHSRLLPELKIPTSSLFN